MPWCSKLTFLLEGFFMAEVLINTNIEVRSKELLRPYELGTTGVPFITSGEELVMLSEGRERMALVADENLFVLKSGAERYRDHPVSNLTFVIKDTEEEVVYENVSYICEVDNIETNHFKHLRQHGSTTLRLIRLNKELRDESGLEWMVEIGFGEYGKEIILKRILLPGGFDESRSVIKERELVLGRSDKKIAETTVEIWSELKIDRFDLEWDRRVKDHLKGGVRDINKKVEIFNVEGQPLNQILSPTLHP